MVLQPISLPSTAVRGVDAIQRSDRVEPLEAPTRTQTDPRAVVSNPAVVVQFGARALSLARGAVTSDPDATTSDLFDADEANAALRSTISDEAEALFANAFGPNETNAALLGALDSPARRAQLLTPGALDAESGLFADQFQSPRESGFFRLPNPASPESLRAGFDYGLEPPTFLGAPANDTLESTFPRAPTQATESGFFSLPNTTAPPAANAEASFPRAAAATESETTFPRTASASATPFQTDALSAQQQRELETLEQKQRQVRGDEQTRRAAAGGYADGVQLRYEVGPDGRRYVVSAEVPLDVTPIPGDAAATLRKMEVILRAANSGSPSISARNAAAEAAQLARQARAQLAADRYAEAQEF